MAKDKNDDKALLFVRMTDDLRRKTKILAANKDMSVASLVRQVLENITKGIKLG